MSDKITYKIYSADLESADPKAGWPIGTATILAEAMREHYPQLSVQIIERVSGSGSGISEDAEDSLRYDVEQFCERFLQNLYLKSLLAS